MSNPSWMILLSGVYGLGGFACAEPPDEEAPVVTVTHPTSLIGVGVFELVVDVTDRSAVEATVLIDGEPIDGQPIASETECGPGCVLSQFVDTRPFADGMHVLEVAVTDLAGNVGSAASELAFADIVFVSTIQVTEVFDGFSDNLEVEVHLFDSSANEFLGCSGDDSGLNGVESSDVLYQNLIGYFERLTTDDPVSLADVRDRQLHVRVIEDDEFSACPLPESAPDDFIGQSGSFPGAMIDTVGPLQFDDVSSLTFAAGRPLVRATRPSE